MDNKIQEKMNFFRSLAGRLVCIPCKKQGGGNITLELLISSQGEKMIPAFFSKESQIGILTRRRLQKFRSQCCVIP